MAEGYIEKSTKGEKRIAKLAQTPTFSNESLSIHTFNFFASQDAVLENFRPINN